MIQLTKKRTFEELVENYWIAVTSEFWSLANITSSELQERGAKLVNGIWTQAKEERLTDSA